MSGVVSQTLLLIKHAPPPRHQSSLAFGSRLVGTKTYIHKVSVTCFTTLTLTDNSGFLWPVLTLWEGWGLLTWSRRTWGPPRFGKWWEEASSEPGEGRDTRSGYRSYVQGDRFIRISNKALFPGQDDKTQSVTLSHCTVSGMGRWGGGVVAAVGKEVSEARVTAGQRKLRRGG